MSEIDKSVYYDAIRNLQKLKREFINIKNDIARYERSISRGFLINDDVKFKSLNELKVLVEDKKNKIEESIIPELYEELNGDV